MRGVALVELLVAMLLTLLVATAVVALAVPARRTFQVQPEISDLHQRLRVAVDALTRDLQVAGAGIAPDAAPAVLPYRVGPREGDPDMGIFYRPGVVSMMFVPAADTIAVSRTYYLRPDPATGVLQLTRYDGIQTDLSVVDGLVALDLTYFDDGDAPLDHALLQDGPWMPSDPDVGPFDMDLLRVRRVRARVRVGGARGVPDQELQFDVALRNRDGA